MIPVHNYQFLTKMADPKNNYDEFSDQFLNNQSYILSHGTRKII